MAALALLGMVVYANSFTVPFLFDDDAITSNPNITQLWPIWHAAQSQPQSTTAGRPVVTLSLALNYAWGGYEVAGYHAFNLCVHVLNAWLLFAIVRRTLVTGRWVAGFTEPAATFVAFAAAALWIVHPLQTEAVTYVIQRTELLMALFYLLTLYAAIRAWDNPQPSRWYLASIVSCGLGMASKEVMASAPIMVVLYDLAFRSVGWRELLTRRRTLYLGLASTWLLLAALMVLDPRNDSVGYHLGISLWQCVRTESWAVLYYLQLAVWPRNQTMDYGPWFDVSASQAAAGAIAVTLLVSVTVWGWRRHAWLGFLGVWMLLILAPTTSVVPISTEPVAERRMYLPLAALSVLAALGLWRLGERVASGFMPAASPSQRNGAALSLAATAVLCGVLGTIAYQRNEVYQTTLSAWLDAFHQRPGNNRAYNRVQQELTQANRPLEALQFLREAVRQQPNAADIRTNLGAALLDHGQLAEAEAELRQAIALNPNICEAHYELGLTLQRLGRSGEALEQFRQAVAILPLDKPSLCELGIELAHHGQVDEAIRNFSLALSLSPKNAAIHYHLGRALARQGNPVAALEHYQEAARLKPDYIEPRLRAGQLLLSQGDKPAAARLFNDVLQLDPKNQPAREGLQATQPPASP